MSKLKMLKFEAAALQSKGKALIEQLQRAGVASLERFDDKRLFTAGDTDSVSVYEKSIEVVADAMEVLKDYGADFGMGMFSGRKQLGSNEYRKLTFGAQQTLSDSYEIVKLAKHVSELEAERVRCLTLIDSLSVWKELDIPLSGTSTETSVAFVGTFPAEYTLEGLYALFAEALADVRAYAIRIFYSSKQITSAAIICHKSCEKELSALLRSLSFTAPAENVSQSAKARISDLESSLGKVNDELARVREKLKNFADRKSDFMFAYDYFTAKRDEYSALFGVGFSDTTIYLRGYVPEKAAGKLSKIIEKNDGVVVYSEPSEQDDVPVLLSNNSFAEPCESIVEMYATPGKKDIDPSSVMAFFYYLLFGMMLSDAGYGLIMTLGSAFILKKTGIEGGMRKMMKLFFYCGISTVFWGALFGSWFGDIVPVICREFLGIQNPPSIALWFEPIADPITLLLFSFVIGIAHLFLGLCVLGYMKWNEGDRAGAIFDTVPIMLTVLGAAPLAGSILAPVPAVVMEIAKYVAIVGVVLIVLTNSRSSKNIVARLGGGLYGLYNIASGYLSDILSYSRLLALGLATGSIASVVNMLGVMPQNMVLKAIVFVIVFVVGHSLNMAINVLGAYVHTNRLQFVELFSKFYEGGGKAFEPLKLNTKYFKLKEENNND